jgi:hypothetical protein
MHVRVYILSENVRKKPNNLFFKKWRESEKRQNGCLPQIFHDILDKIYTVYFTEVI